ncbi:hypothetical protein S40293_08499 [Stachybotrys chartarum IBT 40293]|nr:hypothetical protein S40293_08499 [Stachybotrys chartarum IBT 40293]
MYQKPIHINWRASSGRRGSRSFQRRSCPDTLKGRNSNEMTGVPKSKSCDGCLKVKKRCDLAKPTCSRCARLRIPCTGANSKRYKFLVANLPAPAETTAKIASPIRFAADPFAQVPASPETRNASFFISRLAVHDVRYDVSAYGGFFKFFATTRGSNCKAWLGRKDVAPVSHEEGLAHMVDILARQGCRDEFGVLVFSTLSLPVVYASMTNQRIKPGPEFWTMMKEIAPYQPHDPDSEGKEDVMAKNALVYPSLHFGVLGQLPNFLREPELHYSEICHAYKLVQIDLPKLQSRLADLPNRFLQFDDTNMRLRRDIQSAYGMALAMAIVLNQILESFELPSPKWYKECINFVKQSILLGKETSRLRPIGAGFMVGSLSIAWGATLEPDLKPQLQQLKTDFFTSFKGEDWGKMTIWWHYKFMEIRFRLGRPRYGDDYHKALEGSAKFVSCVQCAASHNYLEPGKL